MRPIAADPAHPASTVLLLRPTADNVAVLLIRRHTNLAFMGGVWVFPGGGLSPADSTPRALERIPMQQRSTAAKLRDTRGELLAPAQSLGLHVAACRETFEEAGVLLAMDANGAPCSAQCSARLQVERTAVLEEPARFIELLERERLYLNVAQLTYWSHWITPSGIGRRFDTRFFAIAAPREQTLTSINAESTEYTWMTPGALRLAAQNDEMPISAPTLCNLEDIDDAYRRHGSIDALLERERVRNVPAILPKMLPIHDGPNILMPWDPEYERSAGEGSVRQEYSEFLLRRPSRRRR